MSHQRSKSFSTSGDRLPSPPAEPTPVPLSINVPRKRSMSISFGLPTSPLSYTGPSTLSSSLNNSSNSSNNNNPSSNPPSANSNFGTTPPTNLNSISNSIPSLTRRFSSSFTNPLTNPFAGSTNNVGAQPEERTRRPSLFGSSPPLSYHNPLNNDQPPKMKEPSGSGGIGGLFRKFSTSGRSGAAQHPMDSNETGPHAQQPGFGPLSNRADMNKNQGPVHGPSQPNNNTINDLKQQESIPRPASPMRNMILTGQMLD
ncbi:hypothetical protein BGZ79_003526 [Entomortierella chlamydospora]|nr:hypothetical protein BGZ79_003526 [Entomortierella chlamydospora]